MNKMPMDEKQLWNRPMGINNKGAIMNICACIKQMLDPKGFLNPGTVGT